MYLVTIEWINALTPTVVGVVSEEMKDVYTMKQNSDRYPGPLGKLIFTPVKLLDEEAKLWVQG